MSSIHQVMVLFLLAVAHTRVLSATLDSEKESNSVELTFYQLSISEWNSVSTSFKTHVAAEVATYCTSKAIVCGLSAGFLFTHNQIGVSSGPEEDSKSLKISFYIEFPTNHTLDPSSPTTYVVNVAIVETILTDIRDSLESTVGCDITYIGDIFYGIDPDSTLNKIIIPIAFVLLLAIIILAVALHMWNKRKEKEEKKKQRALDREKRKKTSRITPVYTMSETNKSNDQLDSNGTATETTPGPAAYSEDPVPLHSNSLPPLPASEEENLEERKREKKEKRRRKREKQRRSAHREGGEGGREESESEFSKTESLEKSMEQTIVPVEDELEVVA